MLNIRRLGLHVLSFRYAPRVVAWESLQSPKHSIYRSAVTHLSSGQRLNNLGEECDVLDHTV